MLSFYELYDLHAIFLAIRSSTDNAINSDVLLSVINVLKNRHNNHELNQFRVALQPLSSLDREGLYSFSLTENKYCYFPLSFLKNDKIYLLLIKVCEHLLKAVTECNDEKTYDLADCLHNLPIFISENEYTIPKKYWKNEIRYYRNNWDSTFLAEEEKGKTNVYRN